MKLRLSNIYSCLLRLKTSKGLLILGLAVSIILLIATWRDASVLFRHSVAAGFNGYYYVLQVDSVSSHDAPYFPNSSPLLFYGLAGLSYVVGDTVIAIKIAGIIIHYLLSIAVLLIVVSLTRSYWAGLMALILIVLSPVHFFFLTEFLKQAFAMCLIAWGCWFALRAWQTKRISFWVMSGLLWTAALFSHKSSFLVLPLLVVFAVLAVGLTSQRNSWRLITTAAACLIWSTPIFLSIHAYSDLPLWLKQELSRPPQWQMQTFGMGEGFVLLLMSPAVLFLLAFCIEEAIVVRIALGTIALWGLLLTINPTLNSNPLLANVFGRLGLLVYIQAAILLAGLWWLVFTHYRRAGPFVAAAVLPLLFLSLRSPPTPGLDSDYLRRRELLIKNLPAAKEKLGLMPLVIAPHGDQFLITSILGVPSAQRLPAQNHYQNLFWLVESFECAQAMPPTIVLQTQNSHSCTVLIKNESLQQLLHLMSMDERQRLLSANSYFRQAHKEVLSYW
jgi:Dolichyl-phosphate-mannose-protein mannosyltransferase